MDVKHTPGPWTKVRREIRAEAHSEAAGTTIATVEDLDTHDGEEYRANARLIAAAPDLLKALRELMTEHPYDFTRVDECECGEYVDYVPEAGEPASCRHTRARAAIAKATGGEP